MIENPIVFLHIFWLTVVISLTGLTTLLCYLAYQIIKGWLK